MFNPHKIPLWLTLTTLLASTSCIHHQDTLHNNLINQPILTQIVIESEVKPLGNPNKSYEEQLARETNVAMDSFYQYQQTYPTIADSGLILIVSDIQYVAPEGEPGLGRYAHNLEGYEDEYLVAPQVQSTLFDYNFLEGQNYKENMKIPTMGSKYDTGYRNNSKQNPAGLFELQALMTGDPFDHYNGKSYLSSAVFEFHNINQNNTYRDEGFTEKDEIHSIYSETDYWDNPSRDGRGILFHGPNWDSTEDGLGSGGCIRGEPYLMSEIGYLVDSLSGDWFHHPETQVPFYIYIQSSFEERPELDQQMIISIKTQQEQPEYLAEQ